MVYVSFVTSRAAKTTSSRRGNGRSGGDGHGREGHGGGDGHGGEGRAAVKRLCPDAGVTKCCDWLKERAT